MDDGSARLGQKVILQPFMSCTLMPVDNIRNIRLRPLLGVNLDSKFDLNIFGFCVQVDEIQPVMMLLNLLSLWHCFGVSVPYRCIWHYFALQTNPHTGRHPGIAHAPTTTIAESPCAYLSGSSGPQWWRSS